MIHPLAFVDDTVELGEDVQVWQFASVIRGARIGAGVSIAANAIVDGAVVGEGTRIAHGASIHPGIVIGRECFIGPLVVLCNDLWPRAWKDGFDYEAVRNGPPSIIIQDGASIGARAVIMPGVTIGAGAMVAADVVVTKSIPIMHLARRNGIIERMDNRKAVRTRVAA